MSNKYIGLFVTFLFLSSNIVNAAPQPAVTYQSLLNLNFNDRPGLLRIEKVDLAFAPEGEIKAAVALLDDKNKVIKSYAFYPEPRYRDKVFSRLNPKGLHEFILTKPGVYNIVFLVEGKPVSRLPFKLEEKSGGNDPFNPTKSYSFVGLWPLYGYIKSEKVSGEKPFPQIHFWVGDRDLPEGKNSDMFKVELTHNNKIIAHSRINQGFIPNKHYKEVNIHLYHPHAKDKMVNSQPFLLDDLLKNNGEYEIVVSRQSDGAVIRKFNMTIQDNKVVPLPATEIAYKPEVDYIVPRVTGDSQRYDFVEAIWIKQQQ